MKAIIKLVISFAWSVLKDKKRSVHPNRLRQVPCKTCRFFTKNRHLKCAVQPHLALTKQAFDCTDYWHQEQSDSLMSDFPIFSATVFDPQTQSWHHIDNLFTRSEPEIRGTSTSSMTGECGETLNAVDAGRDFWYRLRARVAHYPSHGANDKEAH